MRTAGIHEWVKGHLDEVESLLVAAARSVVDAVPAEVTDYDWQQSLDELTGLGGAADCSYDRPSIGAQYLFWYQPRRIEGAIRTLAPVLCSTDGSITLTDMGCGAGAGLWAASLVEAARLSLGGTERALRVEAVDTSPFMLGAAQIGWSHLENWLDQNAPGVHIDVDWIAQSWTTARVGAPVDRVVLASYVFDWSDRDRARDLAARAQDLLDELAAEQVILTCAASKSVVSGTMQGVLVGSAGWKDAGTDIVRDPIASHAISTLGDLRRQVLEPMACPDALLKRDPSWHYEESIFASLRRVEGPAALPLSDVSDNERFVLDSAQEAAAIPDQRMTAILGAAGSGKSRVLVERIARSIEEDLRRARPVRALVTSFNKDMVEQLGRWLASRLGQSGRDFDARVAAGDGTFSISLENRVEVIGMNWDKVPTRLVGVNGGGGGAFTERYLRRVVGSDPSVASLEASRPEFLDPGFLEEELARVVYGMRAYHRDEYRQVRRTGRGGLLRQVHRDPIFDLVMGASAPRTFAHVRIDAHRAVTQGDAFATTPFDLIAVDEYQDFALADFDIVAALVKDGAGIVIAGDPAQALHLGATSGLPGLMSSSHWKTGRRWSSHRLEGSYRMPVRVCEAVAPIALQIQKRREEARRPTTSKRDHVDVDPGAEILADDEIVLPVSVKNAVLGVRPIVVTGSQADVRDQVSDILRIYRPFMDVTGTTGIVTIAEQDQWIEQALRGRLPDGYKLRSESMRKIKGLERPCVIWSTRSVIPETEALAEWVYTILTRSTCLVVIALSNTASADVRSVVSRLRRDRLLFWSHEAERRFDDWCAASQQEGDASHEVAVLS